MRVLQLIDSLRPGGAEQMAVAYANALPPRGVESFLCCTRLEGLLKQKLNSGVGYLFLEKKSSYDIRALSRLLFYVKENDIDIIHAHGSSFFLALLVKLNIRKTKIIWHDHLGERAHLKNAPVLLRSASRFFDGIISANKPLEAWSRNRLHSPKVHFIRNFVLTPSLEKIPVKLQKEKSFKIVCVANLRPEKDHLNLLEAFRFMLRQKDNLSLHLIGQDENDEYSQEIKKYIGTHKLEKLVFLYGIQENISGILKQADLGVLSSLSEGLPVALLEYGMNGLPVVSTGVGEVPEILEGCGKLVPPSDPTVLGQALLRYVGSEAERKKDAANFHKRVIAEYSEENIMPKVMEFYRLV